MQRWFLYAAIAVAGSVFVWITAGDVFHPSLDEGIYLEGGHRIAAGQIPYRDFFAFTGPLIYALQAALERVFGRDLAMLRWPLAVALGLLTAAVYAITDRFAGWRVALPAAIFYLAIILSAPHRLVINHRWISAACFVLALAIALAALTRPRLAILAGALAALAAWATPSFLPALLLLAIPLRSLAYFLGATLASLPWIVWLGANSAIGPMLDRLVWASRQYAAANAVPFAYYPGEFPLSVAGIRPFVAVGVILTGLAAGFVEWLRTRDRRDLLLAIGVLASVLTSYPRWDVMQLPYTLAPALAAAAVFASRRLPWTVLNALLALTMMWSAYQAILYWSSRDSLSTFPTRAGYLRGEPAHAAALEALEKRVPAGSSLFVFPYLPTMGFLLAAENPASFSYLQPGMMSAADEAQVLRELAARPPRFVIRQYFPDDQVLLTWPNSDRSRLSLQSIRDLFDARYRFIERVESRHFSLEILELKAPSTP